MKQLTIKPKEVGTTITVGRLPIFARRLCNWLDKNPDGVVQLVVDGGMYAVEQREKDTLGDMINRLKKEQKEMVTYTTAYTAVPEPDKKAERELSDGLEKLGFVNLNPKTQTQTKTKAKAKAKAKPAPKAVRGEGISQDGRPYERGDLSLFEWLNRQDFLIYTLFIYGNGQPDMNKCVEYDEVCGIFMDAGLPSSIKGVKNERGLKTAQNTANVCLAMLLRKGVIQKIEEDGKKLYSLDITEGGRYARRVYKTVSEGRYGKEQSTRRRILLS